MNREELERRTKQFHIDVLRLCRGLPRDAAGFETGKQLIRSAGSVGANYRASRRAKSDNDFIYKLEVVLEEADESLYWLEVVRGAELLVNADLDRLLAEAGELTAIFVASCDTKKGNVQNTEKKKRPVNGGAASEEEISDPRSEI